MLRLGQKTRTSVHVQCPDTANFPNERVTALGTTPFMLGYKDVPWTFKGHWNPKIQKQRSSEADPKTIKRTNISVECIRGSQIRLCVRVRLLNALTS